MSYDRNPPWRARFSYDEVLPAEPTPIVWPSIAWLVFPPPGQGRGGLDLRAEATT